jgi:hypothetical protein
MINACLLSNRSYLPDWQKSILALFFFCCLYVTYGYYRAGDSSYFGVERRVEPESCSFVPALFSLAQDSSKDIRWSSLIPCYSSGKYRCRESGTQYPKELFQPISG